jgi:hypothetical protein
MSDTDSTPAGWAAREPDDFDLIAHEVYGVRRDARWLQVETLGDCDTPREQTCFRLLMAVPPTVAYKSGPRKGQINWGKRDKSHDRELVVPFRDFDAFRAKRVKP